MANEIKKIDGKSCVSTALLCEVYGVTRQALNTWSKRGCPKAARGYWCLADVTAWREGELKQSAGGTDLEKLPLTQQKLYWEARCREAQAESQNFKNAVLRGDYLDKDTVTGDLMSFFVVLKQSALALPRKAAITAAQYVGNGRARQMENEMREVIEDVLGQWSGEVFADCGVDSPGAGGAQAAGKDQRQRVGRPQPCHGRQNKQ